MKHEVIEKKVLGIQIPLPTTSEKDWGGHKEAYCDYTVGLKPFRTINMYW